MGEFYFYGVVLVLYYFFDMRGRKRTRYKVVKRQRITFAAVFVAVFAVLIRSIVVFMKRRHKFSGISNHYTLLQRRLARPSLAPFDIPRIGFK